MDCRCPLNGTTKAGQECATHRGRGNAEALGELNAHDTSCRTCEGIFGTIPAWSGKKGGTEAIIYTTRWLKDCFGSNKFYALLKLDFRNAFNLVSRAAFLKQVRINLPELDPWVQYCYSDKPHLWVGELRFRSVTGV